MMGKLVGPEDVVTKTTGAFIVLPVNHSLVRNKLTSVDVDLRRARGMCCGCGYCTDLCPRYLLGHDLRPDKTMYGIAHTRGELVQRGAAWMCSECGLCEVFSCPMGLSPRRVNAWMKREMAAQGFKPPVSELKGTHTGRAYRLLPTTRLIARLGLSRYDLPAPLYAEPVRPRLVELRFKQHVGAAASPVVREGDLVTAGQLVAGVPEQTLGVPVHASIGGIVTRIGEGSLIIETGVGVH
jgi:Na+-translocating ferredoxin:NAD+ oxidoreductase RnfC subunit